MKLFEKKEKERKIRIWTTIGEPIDTNDSRVGTADVSFLFVYPTITGHMKISGDFIVIMNGKIEVGRVRTKLIKASKVGYY